MHLASQLGETLSTSVHREEMQKTAETGGATGGRTEPAFTEKTAVRRDEVGAGTGSKDRLETPASVSSYLFLFRERARQYSQLKTYEVNTTANSGTTFEFSHIRDKPQAHLGTNGC